MRKTKIVATLGPATDEPKVMEELLLAGLDVARFNFSHGEHQDMRERVNLVRAACKQTGKVVALLADTKGPEVRLGRFENGKAVLVEGQIFNLTTDDLPGNEKMASVSYAGFAKDLTAGNHVLLDDGLIELVVEGITGNTVTTRVINGGEISDRKGVNVPGVSLNLPFISSKDRADMRLAVELNFDFIAASFVRSAEDIRLMREELHRMGGDQMRIIAKIENAQGVKNADDILASSDGLMVARGDLGVEVEFEELPVIQKELIKKAYRAGKNVITATQMLESMIHNPRPTRAETSDVANAIYDGTSAIMLSGETSVGKYPVAALKAMARIAERTEKDIDYRMRFFNSLYKPETNVTNAISHATVTTAHDLQAAVILTVTKTGETARNISKFRPLCPIIVCTPDKNVQRQLQLAWGVTPLLTPEIEDTTALFETAVSTALEHGCVSDGDLIVITAGVPVGMAGMTNMIKVHEVGEKAPII